MWRARLTLIEEVNLRCKRHRNWAHFMNFASWALKLNLRDVWVCPKNTVALYNEPSNSLLLINSSVPSWNTIFLSIEIVTKKLTALVMWLAMFWAMWCVCGTQCVYKDSHDTQCLSCWHMIIFERIKFREPEIECESKYALVLSLNFGWNRSYGIRELLVLAHAARLVDAPAKFC